MIGLLFSEPLFFLIWIAALLIAITVHEFAHAFVADKLGDPTPRLQGRVTLNPLAHLDPLGTLMLLLVRFGWGKPVQFDPFNLQNPKKDTTLISLAGPAANILLVTIVSILLRLIQAGIIPGSAAIHTLAQPFIYLNLVLAIFNLIPIHPLDGGKILVGLLPERDAIEADQFLRKYGIVILILMLLPIYNGVAPISYFMSPILNFLLNIFIPGSTTI